MGEWKASGNGKDGLKFSRRCCLGTFGARVLSGFAKIWHWVPSSSTHLCTLYPHQVHEEDEDSEGNGDGGGDLAKGAFSSVIGATSVHMTKHL